MELVMEESLIKDRQCRVCLAIDSSMSLISMYSQRNEGKPVDLLNYLVGCKIHRFDQLPQTICPKCLSKLKRAYQFKKDFLDCDQKLKKKFKNPMLRIEKIQQIDNSANLEEENFEQQTEDLSKNCQPLDLPDSLNECSSFFIKYENDDENIQETVYKSDSMKFSEDVPDLNIPSTSNMPYNNPNIQEIFLKVETESFHEDKEISEYEENDDKVEDFTLETDGIDKSRKQNKMISNSKSKNRFSEQVVDINDLNYPTNLICFICDETFPTRFYRDEHLEKIHETNLNCNLCEFVTIHPKILNIHIKNTHKRSKDKDAKNLICEQCGYTASSYGSLTRHFQRVHLKLKVSSEKCSQCPLSYETTAALKAHIFSKHKGGFKCDLCNSSYAAKNSLIIHFQRRHGAKPRFFCSDCKHVFNYAKDVKKHQAKLQGKCVTNYHIDRKKPSFKCSHCPKVFISKNVFYDAHMNAHLNLKPYSCPKCQTAFGSTIVLKHHQYGCENLKSFHCYFENCEERVNRKEELKVHVALVHTGETRYNCKICSAAFVIYQQYGRHMRNKHGVRKVFSKRIEVIPN